MTPLERLNSLDHSKRTAFLAFFGGARHTAQVTRSGLDGQESFPNFGKAECGWIDDRRDFWSRELPALGLIEFSETDPRPARGMVEGSTCWDATITITEEGWEAREAWWAELNGKAEAEA